jgi:hypothetical protein
MNTYVYCVELFLKQSLSKPVSRNMRPFQGIHRETGLESDRGQTSKTMLSE